MAVTKEDWSSSGAGFCLFLRGSSMSLPRGLGQDRLDFGARPDEDWAAIEGVGKGRWRLRESADTRGS